jgi:2'-5' RNA ligase
MNQSDGAHRLRRVFLAFTPDPEVRGWLDALAGRCHEAAGGRRVPAHKLHLTLFFAGQARDAQVKAIAELAAASPAPAVSLLLDRIGFWERRGIVWAGCGECPRALSAWVADLHARARRMGFTVERRPFAPHVTLLRDVRRRPQIRVEAFPWPIESLWLYESRLSAAGSEYQVLESWPTAATGDVK